MVPLNSIFGTDGIRALAGQSPLTLSDLKKIGSASGSVFLKKFSPQVRSNQIIIGKDTRESGEWIENALARGLSESGCGVLSCGVIPTSAVSAVLRRKSFLGGVVISASHNPPDFNGVKFFSFDGRKIPDSLEKEIEAVFSAMSEPKIPIESPGLFAEYPESRIEYLQFLRDSLPSAFSLRGLKWVIDCANGAASIIAPEIFSSLGADCKVIHSAPDGKNINVGSGALFPESLQKAVRESGAHGGCAFDGDADRAQFVDEKGNLLNGDILLWIAGEYLKGAGKLKNNCIVTTVMANFGFFQVMKNLGIETLTTPVGDRAVSEGLESSGCILGGEQSGHIIFKECLPTGDGILTALKILHMVQEQGKPLSYYNDHFPKFPQVLLNVKVKEKIPIEGLDSFNRALQFARNQLGQKGRILVRYSGTEPILRIMVEGESLSQVQQIGESLEQEAQKCIPHG